MLIGEGKLIEPSKLARVFVSPRIRAQTTWKLLLEGNLEGMEAKTDLECGRLAEVGYGAYEGLLTKEIRERRRGQGLDRERPWDIWKDGCEDGE